MKLRIKSQIWNIRKQKTPNQNSKKKKSIQINKDSVRILWDDFKHTNICIMGVSKGEERDQEIENLFEKMTEKLPQLSEGYRHTSPGSAESQTK